MYGVFHGEDIGEIVKILEQVNVLWLIPGSDLCCGFYLGRIDHYLLYDADTENPAEKMDMFSVFIGLDSSSAVSHLRHLEDSRHRFII